MKIIEIIWLCHFFVKIRHFENMNSTPNAWSKFKPSKRIQCKTITLACVNIALPQQRGKHLDISAKILG